MSLRYCFACHAPHDARSRCPNHKRWGGRATQQTKQQLLERDDYTCQECGTPLTWADAHTHHIDTRAMSGNDDHSNLRILCAGCNLALGNS